MNKIIMMICGIVTAAVMIMCGAATVNASDSNGDIVVIVDPGHGGKDCGATSAYDNESDLNWDIALALKAELETYDGVKVYLTKGSSEWFSNAGRGRMGAQLGADLFVSVHNNSGQTTDANGVEVYGTVSASYQAQMKTLSENVLAHVSELGLYNRGYKTRVSTTDSGRDYYTMLDEAAQSGIPGIIIEHCYLGNAHDAEFIHDQENRTKCGVADATAIAEYFGLSKKGVAAGETVTLERTYSAQMLGSIKGTYFSSNDGIAHVSDDGIITAVSAGSAVITCTGADGNSEKVTVNVPEVKNIAIAAGINPTFMDAANVSSFNRDAVMIKAVYSDGSVSQITNGGYTVGEISDNGDGSYDVPVSYNGLSCQLRIYGTGASGKYDADLYKVTGTNADILRYPAVYNGINTGIDITSEIPQTESENATDAVLAGATPADSTEETTDNEWEEKDSESSDGVETDSEETDKHETEDDETEENTDINDNGTLTGNDEETESAKVLTLRKKDNGKTVLILSVAGAVLLLGIIIVIILKLKNRHKGLRF